ncbi:EamA family transporter [Kribbella shirazensis]|uniref:Drug/metabolite transporter (DMT)-like permease n=1 Tax=Kribbella shirazensis TaxID=1105143 RepID=A0A7X5VDG1_9ACTN|nr:EamA family transporter [Kribbella shirazensis]NIK59142.1 drug/metabolite transporter (DMT)-like permease [Kribbella shirazensis]
MRRLGLALAFGTAVISGVSVFVNSYGVRVVRDATVYTTAKNLIAAVVLMLLLAGGRLLAGRRTRHRDEGARPALRSSPRTWLGIVVVAVVGGSVPFVLFFSGLAQASSTHAAFVHKTLVVWVALLAVPLLGERLGFLHYTAIGLLLVGQAALGGGLSGFRFGTGELLLLAATLLWAVEVIVVKRLLGAMPPDVLAVARMGLGVVLLVGWVAVSGHWSALTGLSAEGWRWALLTGLLLAGYVATWYRALALAPAVDVTAVLVFAAIVTAALNAIVKGIAVTPQAGVGLALLAAGAGLITVARSRRTPVLAQ